MAAWKTATAGCTASAERPEAVVNARIHADYKGQGGVVIERYADRFELSNPGSLLVSREQLLRGGVSECRNKSLQLMTQMVGGGEPASTLSRTSRNQTGS
jgi:ATP-dependent DNA helicase RecG